MTRLLVFVLLSMVVSIAMAQQSDFLKYSHLIKNEKVVGNGVFSEKAPSIQEIASNLASFNSDVSFLEFLKSKYPNLVKNYVLVHTTESQQLSSMAHPRIIVFGGGAAFTFSDEPSQKDRRVEILMTNPRTYEVSRHEISFEKSKAQLVSDPKSCVACHGSPARALWNPYDFWPNTFGSAIGMIGTKEEAAQYDSLYLQSPKSELLQRLKLAKTFDFESEDVTAFTQYIGKLNFGRWIAQNLKKPGPFDPFAKPLIALGSMCINEVEGRNYDSPASLKKLKTYFAPGAYEKAVPLLERIRSDQLASRQHFKGFLDKRLTEIFQDPQFLFQVDHSRLGAEVDTLAIMRWLFTLGGVDSSDLSSSLFGNDTLVSLPTDFAAEFVTSLFELRPDLFQDFEFSGSSYGDGPMTLIRANCRSVRTASAKEPKEAPAQIPFQPFFDDIQSRPVLSRCSKCHVEHIGDFVMPAPSIPFNDPMKLAQLLRAKDSALKRKIEQRIHATDRTQMPPSHPLNDEEKAGLMAFLENLE